MTIIGTGEGLIDRPDEGAEDLAYAYGTFKSRDLVDSIIQSATDYLLAEVSSDQVILDTVTGTVQTVGSPSLQPLPRWVMNKILDDPALHEAVQDPTPKFEISSGLDTVITNRLHAQVREAIRG